MRARPAGKGSQAETKGNAAQVSPRRAEATEQLQHRGRGPGLGRLCPVRVWRRNVRVNAVWGAGEAGKRPAPLWPPGRTRVQGGEEDRGTHSSGEDARRPGPATTRTSGGGLGPRPLPLTTSRRRPRVPEKDRGCSVNADPPALQKRSRPEGRRRCTCRRAGERHAREEGPPSRQPRL